MNIKEFSATIIFSAAMFFGVMSSQAFASLITYEHLPSSNSNLESFHNASGPILADDFTPAITGRVVQVDWWGTAANSDSWELVFHTNNNGEPNIDNPVSGGLAKHETVFAAGVDSDGDGIFMYSAAWDPEDLFILAGMDYWLTVANHASDWDWALATGMQTVGSDQFSAVSSTGGICTDGGPHCGPWNAATTTAVDLAFRIHVVPEPAILAIFGLGLVGLGFGRRSTKSNNQPLKLTC